MLPLLVLLACSAPTSAVAEPPGSLTLTAPLDDAAQISADALAGQIDGTHFPRKTRRSAANAPLFLALAARDTASHDIAAAALEAMAESWSNKEYKGKPAADEDYAKVVAAYLGHSEPMLQARALVAAKNLLRQPHEPTIAAVIALADQSEAHRYAVLEALSQVPDWSKREDVPPVFIAALDASPQCASQSLFRMKTRAYSLVGKDQAATKARGLLAHEDPGVRGRAALALMQLSTDKDAAAEAIGPLLDDPHAYTRSAAAVAVGEGRAVQLADRLIAMLDDTEPNTWDLTGWETLDGKSGRVHHDGSPWSRVDDAALQGLKALSGYNGAERLELVKIRHDQIDADLDSCKSAARSWWTANEQTLKK